MLKKFMQNCCRPEGKTGYFILKAMNKGHNPIALWAINFLPFTDGEKLIDIGCGGGANIARLLKKYPTSIVDGADYSQQSVAVSTKVNKAFIDSRCHIFRADVCSLPFADESYQGAIAVETVYFWPDIVESFKEVHRILSDDGYFVVVCEMSDPEKGEKWRIYCNKMRIYTPEEIKDFLLKAGFVEVIIHKKGVWSAVVAKK